MLCTAKRYINANPDCKFSFKGHTGKVVTTLARLLDVELVRIESLRESGMPGKVLKNPFLREIGD